MLKSPNPLLRDRDVDFLLYEMLEVESLCELPAFAEHSRETFDLYLRSARRLAREVLFPAYKPMDESPARLEGGRIVTHPRMKGIWSQIVSLGVLSATRPAAVGGQALPMTVAALAHAYLMAGNLSAYGYAGLTTGAAHLIEAFGDELLRESMMARMYAGEWTGTMALTEPHAGSSLSDVTTSAAPRADGTYSIRGSKIFISGADHDLTANVVNMTLARIEGAPPGIKGVSLFAVPRLRFEPSARGELVSNDVSIAGAIHKIGWRGLPSLALSFGDHGDCRGWLVGEPHKGISYMFQMMNEARIMVGINAAATASVAYHEAVEYARSRPQGRPPGAKGGASAQVPIIEHADVRRMLLRQKAIVEGALALLAYSAKLSDLAAHAEEASARRRASLFLDTLTPIAKTFPAEWGFEANALALQVHGGYGYSSEQLPEAWLRDQKLNSIHEGTTGIHGLDLLGRKVMVHGGEPIRILIEETEKTIARAERAGIDPAWTTSLRSAVKTLAEVTAHLGGLGMGGDAEGMLRHSADYLSAFAIVVVSWMWLWQGAVAKEGLARGAGGGTESARVVSEGVLPSDSARALYEGKLCAAEYWIATELPKVEALATLCRSGEGSYVRMRDEWF